MKLKSKKEISAVEAKFEAQKIAFGPMVFHAVKALRDLGILELLFDHWEKGITPAQIKDQTGLSTYAVEILLESGLSADVVSKLDADSYSITKTGYYILKDELTNVNMNFVSDVCYDGIKDLKRAVETGKPSGLKSLGDWETIYDGLSQLPKKVKESWLAFDHFYSEIAFSELLPRIFERKPSAIVDVGGNTGKWALKCVEYDPDVKVTIVDLPGQLGLARQPLKKKGRAASRSSPPIFWTKRAFCLPMAMST